MPSLQTTAAAFGFLLALGMTLAAAAVFADRLDRVGARLGFTEVLLGVLTAVAADSPELSSSVAAILRGERAVGLGVVLGSNAFNLAAMIGVGAIAAGAVRPARAWLAVESTVALLLLAVTAGLLVGDLPPFAALALTGIVFVPYIAVLVLGDARIHLLPLPPRAHAVLRDALGSGLAHPRHPRHAHSLWRLAGPMGLALIAIVAGATAMVDTSLVLADAVGLSHALVGLLILAVVTSLPNASTALRLARQGRADATVSETLNSNNINLVGGIVIPAAILGIGTVSAGVPCRSRMACGHDRGDARRSRDERRDDPAGGHRPGRRIPRVRRRPPRLRTPIGAKAISRLCRARRACLRLCISYQSYMKTVRSVYISLA